jgi:hypothetical protein
VAWHGFCSGGDNLLNGMPAMSRFAISLAMLFLTTACLDQAKSGEDTSTTQSGDTSTTQSNDTSATTDTEMSTTETVFEPVQPSCSGVDAIGSSDLTFLGPAKLVGSVVLADNADCDGDGCTCSGGLALTDGGVRTTLGPEPNAATGDWQCEESGCDAWSLTCGPLNGGGEYWVWGQAVEMPVETNAGADTGAEGVGASVIKPDFEVTDFCLATTPAGLVGDYRGIVEIGGLDVPLAARISHNDGAWSLRSEPLPCADCTDGISPIPTHTMALEVGDGVVTIDTTSSAGFVVEARFESWRNQLVGPSNGQLVTLTKVQ